MSQANHLSSGLEDATNLVVATLPIGSVAGGLNSAAGEHDIISI